MARPGDGGAWPGSSVTAMDEPRTPAAPSTPWALGDYHRFATTVWELGPVLVAACGIRAASACSTWRPARATSRCARPRPARTWWRRT